MIHRRQNTMLRYPVIVTNAMYVYNIVLGKRLIKTRKVHGDVRYVNFTK